MKRIASVLLIAAAGLLLAGCPKKPTTVPPATTGETVAPSSGATTGATRSDSSQVRPLATDSGAAGADGVLGTTIRFDYDSSEIKPEYNAVITAQAKRLSADRRASVRLEGHTDERGSAEYNVALGERRAQAVKKALELQGAQDSQMSTVSYGEERPVADGHDEAAWAQNRRVEIILLGSH